ncbi:hypothetical protein AAVH_23295 [Aphelenchoides avenae]|nr:hypothetical protein AAVH_23295 [Aphelenchus avenae]
MDGSVSIFVGISEGYTLNQSYQVKENIEVTLRLILPLDLCNASLLLIASSIGILIREHRTVLEPHVSMALLELDTIFVWLQPPISLLIFMRFCHSSKYTAVIAGQQSETDAYFEQFEKQLEAMYDKKHLGYAERA